MTRHLLTPNIWGLHAPSKLYLYDSADTAGEETLFRTTDANGRFEIDGISGHYVAFVGCEKDGNWYQSEGFGHGPNDFVYGDLLNSRLPTTAAREVTLVVRNK